MGENSGIEWTHHTFNPWWGCTKVSPGCDHCYAETLSNRFGGSHWGKGAPRRTFGDKHWNEPKRWNLIAGKNRQRARVFCASMADVFDAEAPAGALDRLWQLIRDTPSLDWLLLTKRPARIERSLPSDWGKGYPNVWLGTTVENDEQALIRIPVLIKIPATVRFLSCEPLVGPVDLSPWLRKPAGEACAFCGGDGVITDTSHPDHPKNTGDAPDDDWCIDCDGSGVEPRTIDWVIAGGESGPKARAPNPIWFRQLRDQCVKAKVAFHFKQWGEWGPYPTDEEGLSHVGKKLAGRQLDGRTWDEFPTPTISTPGQGELLP